jgi:hypothetical protein
MTQKPIQAFIFNYQSHLSFDGESSSAQIIYTEQVTIKNRMISPFQLWRCVSYQIIYSMITKLYIVWFLDFFKSGAAHSPILGADMR